MTDELDDFEPFDVQTLDVDSNEFVTMNKIKRTINLLVAERNAKQIPEGSGCWPERYGHTTSEHGVTWCHTCQIHHFPGEHKHNE